MHRKIFYLLIVLAIGFRPGYAVTQMQASIPLEQLLKAMQQKYDIQFLYETVNLQGKISRLNIEQLPENTDEAVKLILQGEGLTYEKIGPNIYVIMPQGHEKKPATVQPVGEMGELQETLELTASVSEQANLLTLTTSNAPAAIVNRIVAGKVVDKETQEPIPGVNILLKGTSLGTVTGADGTFSIDIPDTGGSLVFSFIGYKTREEPIDERTEILVAMESDVISLGEVVVTAVGIESNKRQIAYAVRNVDTNQVMDAHETNLVSALSAKTAGVQVTSSSGVPGASASIRIRGNKSFRGSNSPMFVIDGVPVDNNSSGNDASGVDVSNRVVDINAADIESMTILSGPSATALYGLRAANGAVIITTKRGKKGNATIKFTSSYAIDRINKLPARQTKYAQGAPSGGVFSYVGPDAFDVTTDINSWGPLISELEFSDAENYPYDKNGILVPKGTGNGKPAKVYDPYKTFFIDGHTFDNNLTVSGGSDVIRYFVSAGRIYQTGVVPNANFQRTSFRANIDADINSRLSVGVSSMFTNSGGNRMLRGSQVSGVMTGVLRNPPTFDIGNGKTGMAAANDPRTYLLPNGEQRTFATDEADDGSVNAKYDNPFFTVNRNPYQDNVNRFLGNINFTYKVFPWLKAQYKLGLDHYTDRRNSGIDVNSASESLGSVAQSVRSNTDINSDFLLLANKEVGENFEINATLGHNFFSTEFVTQSSSGTGLAIPGFFNIRNASDVQSSEGISRRMVVGLYGDFKIIYQDYLILNLTGRNDWSSTLPVGNNSFFYPAVSVGFVPTEKWQLPSSHFLSYAKLRASYGKTGNDAPLYSTNSYYSFATADGDDIIGGTSFPAFGVTAYEKGGLLANDKLRPELSTTVELGGDLKFVQGRLGVELTWYKTVTVDQIVNVTVSAASGYTQYIQNAGTMQNTGIEAVLSGTPVKSNNFSWDISINFTRNRNLVTDVPGEVEDLSIASFSSVSSRIIEGQPYGVLSGTRYKRNEAGQMIIGNDGWPIIDTQQGVIGDPNPDWIAGISNTFTYKGFGLSILWDIRKGGDLWNGTRGFMSYLGVSKESGDQRDIRNFVFDGVTLDGQVNTTPVDFANPLNGLSGIRWRRSGSQGVAEDMIEDGSWVRLRSVSLSYDLPKSKLPAFLNQASLTVYARNLLLFTKYSGIDPETNLRGASNDMGWDYFNHPNTKSFGATLQLTVK
jgi:TonB-linked SusC/RagA family outer membrane protein